MDQNEILNNQQNPQQLQHGIQNIDHNQSSKWFWKDGLSIDETKISILILCLIGCLLFAAINYVQHGDVSGNWVNIITVLVYAIAGVNISQNLMNANVFGNRNSMMNNSMMNNGMMNNGMMNNSMANNGMINNSMANNGMINRGISTTGYVSNQQPEQIVVQSKISDPVIPIVQQQK